VKTYFDPPPAPTALFGAQLARVVDVQDPDGYGRIQVKLYNFDGLQDQDAPIWARVAVPFAGGDRGAFFIPDVGDEIVVTFINGDPRQPIVVGGLWNGDKKPSETLSGPNVDRWTITGKQKTKISIIEDSTGPKVELRTPAGRTLTLDDAQSTITASDPTGNSVTMDASGITITAASKVTVNAATVEVTAGTVTVNSAMSTFSGVVQCNTLIATTVVSSAYTPGAGNIW